MQIPHVRALFAAASLALAGSVSSLATTTSPPDPALVSAVGSPARSPTAVARDPVRHPVEELTFFGLAPTMTVVELWPGGGYWTDILGPYLAPSGHYTIALPAPGGEENAGVARFRARIAAAKDRPGTTCETYPGRGDFCIAPPRPARSRLPFSKL